MKKFLSLILAVTMVFTLFAGIGVSAEEATMMTAERKRSAYAETSNILGNTVSGIYGKGDNISGSWVYDVPAEPDTHNLSVRLSSDELCGVGVTGNRTYFTFQPYAEIKGGVDAFMFYIELPEYNKYGEQWSMRSLSFWMYEGDNSVSVWKTPTNMTIKYLENDAAEWATTTVGANGEYYLPSGFKGYIKLYLNTAEEGTSGVNLYEYLESQGFNTSDGFMVGTLQFDVNYLGGSYGDIVIGGMYNVISDGDALTANLSDEGGAHSKVASLTGTNRQTPSGEVTFYAPSADYGNTVGEVSSEISLTGCGDAVGIWTEPASVGATHQGVKISSETAVGSAHGTIGRISSGLSLPVDPELGMMAMYIEVPEYDEAAGEYWVMQQKSFWIGGTWYTPVNMRISYLEKDGTEWVDSMTGANGEYYLPNGFKGYIKCYLKTATATVSGTTYDYFDALSTVGGIDVTNSFTIKMVQYDFKHIGGDYGDIVVGAFYQVKADGDAVSGNVIDWNISSNNVKLTTYEPTLTADRIGGVYFDDTTYYEGAAVDTNTAKIWDLDWYNNYGDPQAALSWTAPVEPDTSNAAIRVHSDIEEGQGPEIGPSNLIIHPNTVIDPEIGAFMMYVELPKQGTPTVDGPNQWATYAIKTNAVTVYQNMSSAKFGRLYNMTVSYIERDGNEWQTTTCENENLVLPNGFKGYIKLYLNTAIADTSTGETFYEKLESQSLDTTKEYRITDVNIVFGWLGGKFGDMVVGGMYEITEDGNGIYANISEADSSEAEKTCLTTYENDNVNRIALIEDTVSAIGEAPSITDGEAIQNALKAYEDLAAAYKSEISAETLEALYALDEAYNSYRPQFIGSTVKEAVYDDDQALRIDMTLDTSAASANGYTATEYGTVVLTGDNFTGDELFDETAANAVVYKNTELYGSAVIDYSLLLETNSVDTINLDHYLRSYVVYTNGTDTVTVWNAKYNRDAYTTTVQWNLDGGVAAYSEFYYHTSLLLTASYLDIPVLSGSIYGDVDLSGAVDADDIAALKLHLLGVKLCDYEYIVDTNGNDTVSVADLIRFKKYLAGEEVTLGASAYTTYSYIATPESTAVENAVALAETDTTDAVKDITVTSFNLGHFYLGTQYGINPDAYGVENSDKALANWEEDLAKFAEKSDIYAFQEYADTYYWDSETTILPEEVLLGEGKPFKQIETFYGYTQGNMEMGMAFGASSASDYDVHNISYGYLCGKDSYNRRAYLKGYITVKGVEVAVISIHPGFPNNQLYWQDCANEIAALMNAEEYCIVLGDTNSHNLADYLQSRGYNAANHGEFGAMSSYMYNSAACIDNIFTTPNIDILFAEIVADDCGSSDHYPITAELFVNTEMGSTKGSASVAVDSLGFAVGRY